MVHGSADDDPHLFHPGAVRTAELVAAMWPPRPYRSPCVLCGALLDLAVPARERLPRTLAADDSEARGTG